MTTECKVEGCIKTGSGGLGLCNVHYLRWTRYKRYHSVVNRGSGWTINAGGYVQLWIEGKWKYEHIHIAEKALGKKLPNGAVVHHMNENKWDNYTPFNLVICPDQTYHLLLHQRMKELKYENN